MSFHQAQALCVGALLCLPLALQFWVRGIRTPKGDRPQVVKDDSASLRIANGKIAPWVYVLFGAFAICTTVWLTHALSRTVTDPTLYRTALVLVTTAMGCAALSPWYPMAGPIAYLCLSYTFPREHAVIAVANAVGATSWVVALSVAGGAIWWARHRERTELDVETIWAVSSFAAWVAVSIFAAVLNDRPLSPDLVARATRYVHAVALFLVVAGCRPGLRDIRVMALVVAVALTIRQVWLTPSLLLEQNLAMLCVVSVPIVVASVCRPFSLLQVALAPLGAYLTVLVLIIQNRGGVLGLAAAALVLVINARIRRVWLAVTATACIPAILWALRAGMFDRFWQIYSQGKFLGSAAERLHIWTAGLGVARDHLLFGVGPGNFSVAAGINLPAHNSYIELLVETGVIGLLLYLAMFITVVIQFVRLPNAEGSWRRTLAVGLLGSIAAHAVAGLFLGNANLVWTYVLLGVSVSVMAPESGEVSAIGAQ